MWDLIVLVPDHCLSIYFTGTQHRMCQNNSIYITSEMTLIHLIPAQHTLGLMTWKNLSVLGIELGSAA